MLYISDVHTMPPDSFANPLQKEVYRTLKALRIPFERVDTGEAITMDDCAGINKKLRMEMVKTLFLCNRQQTAFYLFVTAGNKPFRASDFSAALGIPRVSFAPIELMERMLRTKIGAATVFSALLDRSGKVHIVFDRDVSTHPWYGCSDGTTTSYLKVATGQIIRVFLPSTGHIPDVIEV
ncbi:conserved hypothetical protein [uncultured Eubacteriales bacterium]|uniref:YbaK/aminoacyl-tRNA synthetase-associated domain-containing protein n=1 Tax=uncultured Eubacteriales bacterium TaxID=172733 RepID=A0A212KEM3_9FIRM|nr:conserved hypothetical protein [uncultured Eubacteriales bacterium]